MPYMIAKETQLSPFWILVLKAVLSLSGIALTVVLPAGVVWVRWVTEVSYKAEQTAAVVEKVVEEIKLVNMRFTQLPPDEWKDRIKTLENDSRRNILDHSDIKLSLEQIKAAVGVKPTSNPGG